MFLNFSLPLIVILSKPAFCRILRVFHLAVVWDYIFSVGSDTLLMGMLQLDALIGGRDRLHRLLLPSVDCFCKCCHQRRAICFNGRVKV